MEPDKAHEFISHGIEIGKQHTEPSRKTLELIGELERRMETKVDSKIGKTAFWTIFATMMAVVSGMFGLVWNEMKTSNELIQVKIDSIEVKTDETNKTVSNIEGKLDPFDFISE